MAKLTSAVWASSSKIIFGQPLISIEHEPHDFTQESRHFGARNVVHQNLQNKAMLWAKNGDISAFRPGYSDCDSRMNFSETRV